MNQFQEEFLDIVKQVRTHLELQRAIGISAVEIGPAQSNGEKQNPAVSASVKTEVKDPAPLSKAAGSEVVQPATLAHVREKLDNCSRCKLCKNRKNVVFGEGNPLASLVFIGEGPGQEEDEQGRPFVGAAGQLLTDIIVKGMRLRREDIYICNIVKCRPPENRNPEPDEIKACEPFLIEQLNAIKPRIIVALGSVSTKALLKTEEGITALRGKWQTYQGVRLMPTFHPAYLLRNPSAKKAVWDDIKKVMAEMGKGKTP